MALINAALVFFILSLIFILMGYFKLAGMDVETAQTLFAVFLILATVSIVGSIFERRSNEH